MNCEFTLTTKAPLAYIDFETQSGVDLREVGSMNYINSSLTRIMSCVIYLPEKEKLLIWIPVPNKTTENTLRDLYTDELSFFYTPEIPKEMETVCKTHTLVAHNAELFDAWLFKQKIKPKYTTTWIDTLHLTRYANIPGGLDKALKFIGRNGKSENTAMMLLSSAKVTKSGIVYTIGTSALWNSMIEYNIDDTMELCELHKWLMSKLNIPEYENKVCKTHASINQLGVKIDRTYAIKIRNLWEQLQNKSKDEITDITGGALKSFVDKSGVIKHDCNSPAKVKNWLHGMGLDLGVVNKAITDKYKQSLNTQVITQILNNPEKFLDGLDDDSVESIIALLALRRNVTRSTVKKIDTILENVDENDMATNWAILRGAQTTGRFSSRQIQLHNMFRGVDIKKGGYNLADFIEAIRNDKMTIEEIERIANENSTKTKKVYSSDLLATLTRTLFIPENGYEFCIADYSAVEARGVAFIADCQRMLNIFADPKQDIYCDMASSLYGRLITPLDETERFIGKQIVLGCGYQMGYDKFDIMCRLYGINLKAINLTSKQCVDAYRKTYPEIPALWKKLNQSVLDSVKNKNTVYYAGKCKIWCDSDYILRIELPSGRQLIYHQCEIEWVYPPWQAVERIQQVTYLTPLGMRKKLYGGIVAENIVQALSCDLLCFALCNLHNPEKQNTVRLHVHDEVARQVKKSKTQQRKIDDMGKIMTTAPDWAKGFPLGIKGFTSARYTKSKFPGNFSTEFLDGCKVKA